MKNPSLLICVMVLAACATHADSVTITDLFASETYDAPEETNAVDREATHNRKTLDQFKAEVAGAFRNETGGVITFDRAKPGVDPSGTNGRSGNYLLDAVTVFFGVGQTSTMELSVDRSVVRDSRGHTLSRIEIWQGNRLGPLPISGPLIAPDGTPKTAGGFLTPGTGIDDDTCAKVNFHGGQIRQLGVTALSAGGPQTMTVTVYFSGGQSESQTEQMAGGFGTDDVFFYFAAPLRETIVSMSWDSDTVNRPGIDDLAFMFSAAGARCTFMVH